MSYQRRYAIGNILVAYLEFFRLALTQILLFDYRHGHWLLAVPEWYSLSTLQIKPKFSAISPVRTSGPQDSKISFTLQFHFDVEIEGARTERLLSSIFFSRVVHFQLPLNTILLSIQAMIALITYAVFANCDPVLSGEITAYDQLFPHLVMRLFGNIPALRGLFLSTVFAAALRQVLYQ